MGNSEFSTERLRIAAAGRTNAGKTTLIRTLACSPNFGEVADRANVTQQRCSLEYEAVHAIFIDAPGFQNAGLLRSLLTRFRSLFKGDGNWKEFRKAEDIDGALDYDEEATSALEATDVVLYVCTLEDVPTLAHREEVELVKSRQNSIVGVINKYGLVWRDSPKKVEHRVALWKEFLTKNGISQIVSFDAHWDQPRRVSAIYDAISAVLPPSGQQRFAVGLEAFKSQQDRIRRAVVELIAKTVQAASRFQMEGDTSVHSYDEKATIANLQSRIRILIGEELERFVGACHDLYRKEVSDPDVSASELMWSALTSKDAREGLNNVASSATIGASTVGLIGALIGTVLLPGIGTIIGATIGGGVGGAGGAAVGASRPTNTHVRVSLSEVDLQLVFDCCLAIVWAVTFQGFGKSGRIDQQLVSELRERMRNASGAHGVEFLSATKGQLVALADGVLDQLDSRPPAMGVAN